MRKNSIGSFRLAHMLYLSFSLIGILGCQRDSTPANSPKVNSAVGSPESATVETSQLLRQIELALERGDVVQAKRDLATLFVRSPENPAGLFILARIKAYESDINEALRLLALIPASNSEFGFAAIGQRADFLSQLSRLDEAIELWQQMLQADDSLDIVRSRLASDLYAAGRRIEASWPLQELADRGAASEDELRGLLCITNSPKSLDELVRDSKARDKRRSVTGELDPTTTELEMTLPQAWELIHQRRYDEAATVLEAVIQTAPTTEAMTLFAFSQANIQRFEEARATLSKASSEAIKFATYWIAVGDDWYHRGDDHRAVAAYAKAMLLDPTWELTHERCVGALLRLNETKVARQVDERRFGLADPIDACLAVGKGQPDEERACSYLVNDLKRLGQTSQACGWMRHVVKRNPNAFGGSESVEKRCRELLAMPKETIQSLHLAGVNIKELPDPTPDFQLSPPSGDSPLANSPLLASTQPKLVDVAASSGLNMVYHNFPQQKLKHLRLHEGLGSGVAALDFDRDGWTDFYFGQGSGDPPEITGTRPNALMRKVDGRFETITMLAGCDDRGYATGMSAGDWNQDGWDDILVGNLGKNRLFLNQSDGTFVDATDRVGLLEATFTSSVAFADLDADGLVDIVEINYIDDLKVFQPLVIQPNGIAEQYPGPNQFRSGLDALWLSQGDGTAKKLPLTLADGSRGSSSSVLKADAGASSLAPQIGDDANPGLGVVVSNLDADSALEIFVANDTRPNQLWEVTRSGNEFKLSQSASVVGLATSSQGRTTACMGVATSDFDRDGRTDLFVTNWFEESVNLYLQRRSGVFQDLAPKYQLDRYSNQQVGFGTQAIDFDNDGWDDIFVANGHINDYSHLGQPLRMLSQLLINRRYHFEPADLSSGPESYWTLPHVGRCVITTDHNRDGRLDVVVTDLLDPVALLENETTSDGHFIQFQLVGVASERSAIGTQIEILDSSPSKVQTTAAGNGYLGRNEPLVHFGLGSNSDSVTIRVTWPDSSTQQHAGLKVDTRYLLVQGEPPTSDPVPNSL